MFTSKASRARWAAIGAAVAVSIGAGGVWVTHAAAPPSSIVLIEPARILDTRDGTDLGLPGPFTSPVAQDLKVTGEIPTADGLATVVPAGATGVLLNVTPVQAEADGFISVRPADAAGNPTTSSLNFVAGETNPNSVQVELPTDGPETGEIEISYDALGVAGPSTEILVDVVGYTLAGGGDPGVADQVAALQAQVAALQSSLPFAVSVNQPGVVQVGAADAVVLNLPIDVPVDGQVTLVSSSSASEDTADDEARCSITDGTTLDVNYLQRWESSGTGQGIHAQIGGVRTFDVTPGAKTYKLVCDHVGTLGQTTVLNASVMTAIFTPANPNPLCDQFPEICSPPAN